MPPSKTKPRATPPRLFPAPPFPTLPTLEGLKFATASTGLVYQGRADFLLVALPATATGAGVFTRSQLPAAPVLWTRRHCAQGRPRVLVVNAGNANAFTGTQGLATVKAVARKSAAVFDVRPQQVWQASTGIIGHLLPQPPMLAALDRAATRLARKPRANKDGAAPLPPPVPWRKAARAIMTTDRYPKAATCTVNLGGVKVHLVGIAKGAAMIAPNMATTLAFVFTDAALPAKLLQSLLRQAIVPTFNSITVDADTSTNDTALLLSTGVRRARGAAITSPRDVRLKAFRQGLHTVLERLAMGVVSDGEGARLRAGVRVEGAASNPAAQKLARAVASSLLVKTALAGADSNWGRIVMALGNAGVALTAHHVGVEIHGTIGQTKTSVVLARHGRGCVARKDAPVIKKLMAQPCIDIVCRVGRGRGTAFMWTCDIGTEYVRFNSAYPS